MECKRTWIYCRVAHPDALALAVQQRYLEAYAEAQGLEIVGTTAEQASGLDLSRRGLVEVSDAVTNGKIDCLLVKNPCRLGRDIGKLDEYLNWLKAHQVEVIYEDGSVPQTNVEILLGLLNASGLELNMAT